MRYLVLLFALISFNAFSLTLEERKSSLIPIDKFFSVPTMKQMKAEKAKKAVRAALTGKGHVDLSSRDTPIVEQWDGTCTAHALTAVIENATGNKIKLSERHVWSKYGMYNCEIAINAWTGADCVTQNMKWPHEFANPLKDYLSPAFCDTFLVKSTNLGSDIQKAINTLDAGNPVYLGVSVTNSMYNCDKKIDPSSPDAGGGHALSIVGYDLKEGYFKYKNSWGKDCGEGGYQYLPFKHCQRPDLYCLFWSIDEVKIDSSPRPQPVEKKCVEWSGHLWWKKCVGWK
jgi:hypothetical protein